MEKGNIKISEICRMEINTIGNDCFTDIDTFRSSLDDPEWMNFKEKVKDEKNINMENVLREGKRLNQIREETTALIFESPAGERIKEIISKSNNSQMQTFWGRSAFEHFFSDFFAALKKNISEMLPCDLDQSRILKLTLLRTIKDTVNKCKWSKRPELLYFLRKRLEYYFAKNEKGICEPSLDNTNNEIKQAFKNKKKPITDLCAAVDTRKQNSLKNTSTTWKTVRKMLKDEDGILQDLDIPAVCQYKTNLFTFMEIKNFYMELLKYISALELSQMIESLISFQPENSNEERNEPVFPKNSTEYFLMMDSPLDEDAMFLDRSNPEDMDSVLSQPHQKKYIKSVVDETENTCIYQYGEYSRQKTLFFIETLCSGKKIGESSEFFFKWANARVEYGEYKGGIKGDISAASDAYLSAYECGLYFAGPYIKKFCQEAIEVFMIEWKSTKKVNRIKDIYKFASSIGITLQLYQVFKESGFDDYSIIHPYQHLLDLWDYGYDIIGIAQLSGLPWQKVKRTLTENIKYLKRKDPASVKEMESTYISKWDCDGLGIDTYEEFHD